MMDDVHVWKNHRALAKHHSVYNGWLSCRLWRAPVLTKHAVAILSPTAAKQRWSSRIKDYLTVQVRSPPQHVCPKCKHELQTLEKDAEDSGE